MELHDEAMTARDALVGALGILERTSTPLPSPASRGITYVEQPETPVTLPFEVERQLRTRWCWAAVAVSIETYYAGSVQHAQCELAAIVLGSRCCDSHPCNRSWYLDHALSAVGHCASMDESPMTLADLRQELVAGRVVCALVSWRGGGGHFVAIDSVRSSPDGTLITVADPRYGSRTEMLAARFATMYEDIGAWTVTYSTSP